MSLVFDKPCLLYANCVTVKGVTRSTISDLIQKKYYFIPNALCDILNTYRGYTLNTIFNEFNPDDREILTSYFTFLQDRNLIHFTTNPAAFPQLHSNWDIPAHISNAIIDIGPSHGEIDYESVITQLSELGCKAIQIRSYIELPDAFWFDLLHSTKWNRIRDIQLVMASGHNEANFYAALYDCNLRISSILVHSAIENKELSLSETGLFPVIFTTQKLTDASHCGAISPNYFAVNVDTYLESGKFNSCLHKKVGIDADGQIKNCPSLNVTFGNVKTDLIADCIHQTSFKRAGNIRKDDIDDCKVCEFRRMCTDCRLGVGGRFNEQKKPSKCNYNPHTGQWNT